MKLNIGCGRDYREGWWNSDIGAVRKDATHDIRREKIPFFTNSAEEIYISGVLEQILENEDLVYALNECHRVLAPGAFMTVVVPNARYAIAHQDPMDTRKFTRETFLYLLAGTKQYQLYGSVYGFIGWSRIQIAENERHILTIRMTK